MADSVDSVDGSSHTLSFGAHIGSQLYIVDVNTTVSRDNMEKPDLILTANVTNATDIYTQG